MAHFAELDENNVVLRVIVVGNQDCLDAHGKEDEQVGIAFCRSLFGQNTRWVQTSYNTKLGEHYDPSTKFSDKNKAKRKNYAAIGDTYDPARDMFIGPKPFPSWFIDDKKGVWMAPKTCPKPEHKYHWDEATQQWILR